MRVRLGMKALSRREMLKGSLLAPAVAAAASGMNPVAAAMQAAGETAGPVSPGQSASSGAAQKSALHNAVRERLMLDFGWRFHFGDASDAAKDFGFGSGRAGNFQ